MQNSNLIKRNNIKSYCLTRLSIEVTRRCNRKCIHCLRGLAQKTIITPEIIDRIFDEVKDCKHIALKGGESLLEMDMLEYLIRKIINSRWNIKVFQFTSNGTIYNENVMTLLNELYADKKCRVILRISGDSFHNQDLSSKTFEKYNIQNKNNNIELVYIDKVKYLKSSGRGKEYIENNKSELGQYEWITDVFVEKRIVSILGETIYSPILLAANGNITFDDECTYDILDSIAMGNILEASLKDIFENNNIRALLIEKDFEVLREIKSYINYYRYYKTESYRNYMRFKLAHKIYSVLWDKRKEFHQLYPHIKTEYIVNKYPMSDYDVFLDIDRIYDCVHYAVDSMSHTEWLEFIRAADKELYDEYLTHEDELSYDGKDIFTVYALYQKPDVLHDYLKKEVYTRSNYFENVTCTYLV